MTTMSVIPFRALGEWQIEAVERGYEIRHCDCNDICTEQKLCEHLEAFDSAGSVRGTYRLHLGYGYLDKIE